MGLSNGITIAQCKKVKVTLLEEFPMQVDGEPWKAAAGTKIEINHLNQGYIYTFIYMDLCL